MKFVISDSNGRKYLANSTLKSDLKSTRYTKDECIENNVCDADEQLTSDEIKILKELVKYADSLFNLVKSQDESDLDESNDDNIDSDENSEEVIEYSAQSEDEDQNLNDDIDEDNIGNAVNTDLSDSANSYGSIENQNRVSSFDDNQEAIINAWKNRKY